MVSLYPADYAAQPSPAPPADHGQLGVPGRALRGYLRVPRPPGWRADVYFFPAGHNLGRAGIPPGEGEHGWRRLLIRAHGRGATSVVATTMSLFTRCSCCRGPAPS